jgi:hypothetical protein
MRRRPRTLLMSSLATSQLALLGSPASRSTPRITRSHTCLGVDSSIACERYKRGYERKFGYL